MKCLCMINGYATDNRSLNWRVVVTGHISHVTLTVLPVALLSLVLSCTWCLKVPAPTVIHGSYDHLFVISTPLSRCANLDCQQKYHIKPVLHFTAKHNHVLLSHKPMTVIKSRLKLSHLLITRRSRRRYRLWL